MASTIIGRSSRPSRIGPSYCTIRLPSSACRVRPVRRSTPMGGAGICCCPHRLISCRAQQARITNNRTFYWGGIFMHAYTESIRVLFTGHADPQKAAPMKRYMRDQFEYLGIKGPEMGSLLKQHIREHGLPPLADLDPILRELWALPQREFQYAASGLLEKFEGGPSKPWNICWSQNRGGTLWTRSRPAPWACISSVIQRCVRNTWRS